MKDSSVIFFIVIINSIVLTNKYKKKQEQLRPIVANISGIKRYLENIKLKDEIEKRETKNHGSTNGYDSLIWEIITKKIA